EPSAPPAVLSPSPRQTPHRMPSRWCARASFVLPAKPIVPLLTVCLRASAKPAPGQTQRRHSLWPADKTPPPRHRLHRSAHRIPSESYPPQSFLHRLSIHGQRGSSQALPEPSALPARAEDKFSLQSFSRPRPPDRQLVRPPGPSSTTSPVVSSALRP